MRFIPYLGNKRKLIEPILEAIGPQSKVLDLFSGSGVVSYHLRTQGVIVHANDTASYSYHINKTYLEEIYEPIFLQDYIAVLNEQWEIHQNSNEPYFSKYYSENPNASKERIYYTYRNGAFIDFILENIWNGCTVWRSPILCELLYRMCSHANTSGIFKSWHKKIAGEKRFEGVHKRVYKSNHKRITTPIKLEMPITPKGPEGKAFQYDAIEFFDKVNDNYDAIYIDPPYNTHQYSANYHLLEQACRPLKDRYVPTDNQESGIQPDLYKSPYCSKKKFHKTFIALFDKIKDKTNRLVVSYNSKGFLSPKDIENLLQKRFNEVSVKKINYFNYRGGRAAKEPVHELLFIAQK